MLLFFSLCALSIIFYTLKTGISPYPTSKPIRETLFTMIPSHTGPIIDLGSGWGSLIIPLAKRYPSHQIIGYELSPIPYFISLLRKWASRSHNIKIYRRNFLKENLSEKALYICYLYPGGMRKIEEILSDDTAILTHTFALRNRVPQLIKQAQDLHKTNIFLYLQ